MSSCGIVAEYNPFHLGHQHQIDKLRNEHGVDLIVAAMSGHFLQRGIPALVDKWTRAKMAVVCGVDIVVEIPCLFSCASADIFAMGALKTLSHLNVDNISFGCEKPYIPRLLELSSLMNTPEYKTELANNLSKGLSFVSASSAAIGNSSVDAIPPNATLALAYYRAIEKLGLNYKPIVIERLGADYHDEDPYAYLASAAAIRTAVFSKVVDWDSIKSSMPLPAYEILKAYPKYVSTNDFTNLLLARIFTDRQEQIKKYRGVIEGLENRIYTSAMKNMSFDDLLNEVSTKRYTKSTIRRALVSIMMGIPKSPNPEDVSQLDYRRVLAMSERGKKHLASLRKSPNANLLINLARDIKKINVCSKTLGYDIMATSLYSLACEAIDANSDYKEHPFLWTGAV